VSSAAEGPERPPAAKGPEGSPAGKGPEGSPAARGAEPSPATNDGDAHPAVAAKVVDAARFVLAEGGPAGATLERIAAAAGVSRMTLHRQGVTKAEIVRALAQRFEQEHKQAMWRALVANGTAAERLRLALELQCRLSEQNLAVLEALDGPIGAEIFHEPGPDALTRSVFVDPLHRLLLDGAIDGTLRADDPREAATVLYNAVGHTYRHLRSGHGWSPRRAREGVLRLVLDGLVVAPRDGDG
jgi:AcrR family transcriptional regulator